jgi:arsenate reductase
MIFIYHNPRCRKSREALELIEKSGLSYQVVDYQKNPLSMEALLDLIEKLGVEPIDLIRKNEALWKDTYREAKLAPKDLVRLIQENPKLLERPILAFDNNAVIGRPTERVEEFLNAIS